MAKRVEGEAFSGRSSFENVGFASWFCKNFVGSTNPEMAQRPRLISMGRLPEPIPAVGEFQGRSERFSDSVVAQPVRKATAQKRAAKTKN
jgi:hypothetical protein